jgi:LysM repeat protein
MAIIPAKLYLYHKTMLNNILLFSFLLFMTQGCVNQVPAPIEYNHDKTFDYNASKTSQKYSEKTVPILQDTEVIVSKPLDKMEDDSEKTSGVLSEPNSNKNEEIILPKSKNENTTIIYHDVQEGETIDIIANNYDQSPEEIASLNNLTKPYHLDEFQTLKIKVNKEILNRQNTKNSPKKSKFSMPVQGDIIIKFGQQTRHGKSNGINIIASDGTEIKSVTNGEVTSSGNDNEFGNFIIIKSNDIYLAYAHMQDLLLEKGAKVQENDIIGYVGATGSVKAPQLYFAIKKGNTLIDPEQYIKN